MYSKIIAGVSLSPAVARACANWTDAHQDYIICTLLLLLWPVMRIHVIWIGRYVKLRVTYAPRMPGTFSPPPWVSNPDMDHGTCVTHVPWCMPGSLISHFLSNRRRGNRLWHIRRMHNTQFYVSGKRPITLVKVGSKVCLPMVWFRAVARIATTAKSSLLTWVFRCLSRVPRVLSFLNITWLCLAMLSIGRSIILADIPKMIDFNILIDIKAQPIQ